MKTVNDLYKYNIPYMYVLLYYKGTNILYLHTNVGTVFNSFDVPLLLPALELVFFLRIEGPDLDPPGGVEMPELREALLSTFRLREKRTIILLRWKKLREIVTSCDNSDNLALRISCKIN